MAPLSEQQRLNRLLIRYRRDPVAFVKEVIGVNPTDQQEQLILSATRERARTAVKSCTASGKTAVLAWLTFYFLICFPDCRMLVTAPTANQLHRVFRSEVAKWLQQMRPPFNGFFEIMSDKIFIKGKKDTQFCGLVTGSPENKESFAGLHAEKVVVLVDEASALPSEIFDTLLGTLSSGETSFVLVSNPVRSQGAFYDLFQTKGESDAYEAGSTSGKDNPTASRWDRITFDSYGSPNVDKDWIAEVIEHYGEDSDFVKMRIHGEFPVLSDSQFISTEHIDGAAKRVADPRDYMNFPRVLGADPARFGDDHSVLVDRQGPKIHDIHSFKGLDTVEFAERILRQFRMENYQCVYVDGIGIGAGVVDQLKRFSIPTVEVLVNSKPSDPKSYSNQRAQIYGHLKDWLTSADIPRNDKELREDLAAINYFFNGKLQIVLESKKDMKKRIKRSPDRADALALTFASEVFNVGNMRKSVGKIPVKRTNYLWA